VEPDGLAGGSLGERPQRRDGEMVRLLSGKATCGTFGSRVTVENPSPAFRRIARIRPLRLSA
jgi:hypothetical protein